MTGIGKTQFYKNLLKEGFREHCRIPLKPKQKQHHVGIEIECYSKLVDDEVFALLLRYELDKNVNITDDGSIDPPDGYCSYELRILGKEKELPKLFTKLGKFLNNHFETTQFTVSRCEKKYRDFRLKFFHALQLKEIADIASEIMKMKISSM